MNLVNATRLSAGYTMAVDKTGHEWLVVVAKGTYGIPEDPDCEPPLLQEQIPLVTTDVYTGEPGSSALLHENDFAPIKLRCDVLLNGSCYAPEGKPAQRVDVALRVGSLMKSFRVVGHRVFQAGMVSRLLIEPEPFASLPIDYNNAYGGIDRTSDDPAKHRWYPLNFAGVGFHPKTAPSDRVGMPLPNTEALDIPVSLSDGRYAPMAFGPVGRAWQQRVRWAGTYDQEWLDNQHPFLPSNFDVRYFQSSPEDQQMDYPQGREEVRLLNLRPQKLTSFRLPSRLELPLLFSARTGVQTRVSAVVDTVLLEPDQERFSLVWRGATLLRRNIREITQVLVGDRLHR